LWSPLGPLYDRAWMDPETQRLINLLKVSLRILGISNREVARRLGMSPSYVSKLFSGASPLRVDHLISVCRAAGMEPAEFFAIAYPLPATKPSLTASRLRELLQSVSLPPLPAKEPEPISQEKIHEMLKATLETLIARSSGS
jgi:transcriptional regulator with XRE-family HTH domain